MKIYDFALAPNPRRLRIFVAEKGLKIPMEQVDIFTGKNRTPEMLAKNPAGGLPVMELDDGTHLAESVAICRYLEGMHPEPNMMGKNSREQAEIEMWNRRVELGLFSAAGRAFQHTNELFKARLKQFPEYGETQREAVTATASMARRADRQQAIHRGRSFHDCGHHRRGRGRFRCASGWRHCRSRAQESCAMVQVSIDSSEREGLAVDGSIGQF